LTTVNRWTSMITPVASLHQATGGDLARSLVCRELLCRYQIRDIATSVHRDRFGCWAFLDLWRRQGATPFAAAELEFLHSIAGPPLARVHLGSGHWLTLRAARMDSALPVPERDIAVTIETTAPGGRVSLFARASGLSSREAELLDHLITGAGTRDIARLMFLS